MAAVVNGQPPRLEVKPDPVVTPTESPAPTMPPVLYAALLGRGEGVLYESDALQIGIQTEFRTVGRAQGDVALFYGNKLTSSPLTRFTVHVRPRAAAASPPTSESSRQAEPLLVRSSTPALDALPKSLAADTQLGHVLRVECTAPYASAQMGQAPLVLEVHFSQPPSPVSPATEETHVSLCLPLPLPLSRFLEPVMGALGASDFFARWHQIGAANPREAQQIFPVAPAPPPAPAHSDPLQGAQTPTSDPSAARDHDQVVGNALLRARRVLSRAGFAQLPGIDKNPANLVGAGVLHTSQMGNVGCLLRLELNRQSGVRMSP